MIDSKLESVKLKNIALIGDGAHASLKREDSGILYLTSKNFKQDGISLDMVDYISKETYQKYFKERSKALTKPKENDILLSIIGTMGAPYIVKKDDIFGLSSSVSIIRPNNEIIDSKYLYYWIKSPIFQGSIESIKSGVAQSFLSLPMIGSLPVKYPKELKEQKKIAKILSNYDDLIENYLRQIQLLEEKARLIYEEWFLRFRIDGQKLEIDEETGLPFGWEKKKIKDFGDVITGKTPVTSNQDFYNGDVPFVKTPDMHTFPYVLETNEYLTTLGADSQKNKYLPKNSLMVSCIGTAGVYSLVAFDCQTNQQINSIKFHKEEYVYYMYCFAESLKNILDFIGSNGATMTNVNKTKFENIEVVMPEFDILEKYYNEVKNNFEVILNLLKQNQLLKESRDILLPRLMTGMIDVENMDIEV